MHMADALIYDISGLPWRFCRMKHFLKKVAWNNPCKCRIVPSADHVIPTLRSRSPRSGDPANYGIKPPLLGADPKGSTDAVRI